MEAIKFEDLNLDAKILRAVTDMGFEAASPIQGQSIPLDGHLPTSRSRNEFRREMETDGENVPFV